MTKVKVGSYYTLTKDNETLSVVCVLAADNGWFFEEIDRDFNVGGRTLIINEKNDYTITEIYKKPIKPEHKQLLFKAAFTFITDGDLFPYLCGDEIATLRNYEHDHSVFSDFWYLEGADKEDTFISNLTRGGSDVLGISHDVWVEDEEDIMESINKLRVIKYTFIKLGVGT